MESLAEQIARAFPLIGQVEPLQELGSGVRSDVVETAGGFVVKIARTPGVTPAYEYEWRALSVLAGHLSVPVPHPRWRSLPARCSPSGRWPIPGSTAVHPRNTAQGISPATWGDYSPNYTSFRSLLLVRQASPSGILTRATSNCAPAS